MPGRLTGPEMLRIPPTSISSRPSLTDRMRREYAKYCMEQNIPNGSCDVNQLLLWLKVHIADPLRLGTSYKKNGSQKDKDPVLHNRDG